MHRPHVRSLRTADCRPLRAVFYAATDWLRLTTETGGDCVAVRAVLHLGPAARGGQVAASAERSTADSGARACVPRARGDQRHRLDAWVASTGSSWYQAGVEARRRMAATGYDVAAGDTWALNELSSAVRQGAGNARANMRAFLNGLYDGDGTLPAVRGTVFIAGIGQATTDLSLYQARLQDWYEDAAFWIDLGRFASDWSQEVYGDIRHYAVAGTTRETRRDAERVPAARERPGAASRRRRRTRREASWRPTTARSRTPPGGTTPHSAGRTSPSS